MKCSKITSLGLLLALFLTASVACGQNQDEKFKVVYVQGKVLRPNGNPLQVGDVVSRNEAFRFDPQALVAIFNARIGRIVLPETGQYADALTASAGTGVIALRDEVVDSLRPRLNNGQFLVLGQQGTIDLYIHNDMLRQAQLEYAKFAVRYRYRGQEFETPLHFGTVFNGELESNYKLTVPAKGLFKDGSGQPISTAELEGMPVLVMTRGKDATDRAKAEVLCFFMPVIPDDPEGLRQEVGVVVRALQASPGLTSAQRLSIIRSFLEKNYARPTDDESLRTWLQQTYQLNWN
jgi:hypothetical protein